jgi:hypothetical protein
MNTTEPPELGLTDEQIDEIRQLALGSLRETAEVDLPEGDKQILIVSGHKLISSNFVESQATGKVDSSAVLLLLGKAAPSSNPLLQQAYITFMDDAGKLRRPAYSKKKGTIWLHMPLRMLPVVLAQIHETNVFCWIGHYANGHIWGDIHTSH